MALPPMTMLPQETSEFEKDLVELTLTLALETGEGMGGTREKHLGMGSDTWLLQLYQLMQVRDFSPNRQATSLVCHASAFAQGVLISHQRLFPICKFYTSNPRNVNIIWLCYLHNSHRKTHLQFVPPSDRNFEFS